MALPTFFDLEDRWGMGIGGGGGAFREQARAYVRGERERPRPRAPGHSDKRVLLTYEGMDIQKLKLG